MLLVEWDVVEDLVEDRLLVAVGAELEAVKNKLKEKRRKSLCFF
jgi:hypothetical protein